MAILRLTVEIDTEFEELDEELVELLEGGEARIVLDTALRQEMHRLASTVDDSSAERRWRVAYALQRCAARTARVREVALTAEETRKAVERVVREHAKLRELATGWDEMAGIDRLLTVTEIMDSQAQALTALLASIADE